MASTHQAPHPVQVSSDTPLTIRDMSLKKETTYERKKSKSYRKGTSVSMYSVEESCDQCMKERVSQGLNRQTSVRESRNHGGHAYCSACSPQWSSCSAELTRSISATSLMPRQNSSSRNLNLLSYLPLFASSECDSLNDSPFDSDCDSSGADSAIDLDSLSSHPGDDLDSLSTSSCPSPPSCPSTCDSPCCPSTYDSPCCSSDALSSLEDEPVPHRLRPSPITATVRVSDLFEEPPVSVAPDNELTNTEAASIANFAVGHSLVRRNMKANHHRGSESFRPNTHTVHIPVLPTHLVPAFGLPQPYSAAVRSGPLLSAVPQQWPIHHYGQGFVPYTASDKKFHPQSTPHRTTLVPEDTTSFYMDVSSMGIDVSVDKEVFDLTAAMADYHGHLSFVNTPPAPAPYYPTQWDAQSLLMRSMYGGATYGLPLLQPPMKMYQQPSLPVPPYWQPYGGSAFGAGAGTPSSSGYGSDSGLTSFDIPKEMLIPPSEQEAFHLSQPPQRIWHAYDHQERNRPTATFTVMCYNVLCDKYCTRQLYGYSPSWSLSWEYRKKSILEEIQLYGADIISLQEVETEQFHCFFKPELKKEGYEGIFAPKSRARTMCEAEQKHVDGCAIFWKVNKFKLMEQQLIEFNQLAIANAEGSKDMLNRVMTKDNIGLVALLETKEGVYQNGLPPEGQVRQAVMVATVHVVWDPEFCDVKLIQTLMLTNELKNMMESNALSFRPGASAKVDSSQVPMILCGDFNSLPDSGVVELLREGKVARNHEDFKDIGYQDILKAFSHTKDTDYLSHGFKLKQAFEENFMQYTNYTYDFKGMIDYIFYTEDHMNLLGALGPLSADWFKENKVVGCPGPHIPSDHFSLLVELEMPVPIARQARSSMAAAPPASGNGGLHLPRR